MRKISRILAVILIAFAGLVTVSFAQTPVVKAKKVTALDSNFYTYQGAVTLYKYCRTTLYNPTDTLTDSAAVYHVSRFVYNGVKDSVYTRVGFKKLSINGQDVQNDTIYYAVSLPDGESMEVLVWMPFPEGLFWNMYNAIFDPDREMWIKNTYVNE